MIWQVSKYFLGVWRFPWEPWQYKVYGVICLNCEEDFPLGFLCLNAGCDRDHATIVKEVVASVRKEIGPVAAFKMACVVDRLPKTRSGKILRGTMVKIADSQPFKMPATIDDPAILDEIKVALKGLGYAKE